MMASALSLSFALLFVSPILANSTDIATWVGLRGARIQSAIVLEGGLITHGNWDPTTSTYQSTVPDLAPFGIYYQINLTKDFDINSDSLDTYLEKSQDIGSDSHAPTYVYGAIFNNDYSWYTIGGEADRTPIGLSTVTRGDVFQSAPGQSFTQSPHPNQQTPNVMQYISSGAYASTPDGMGYWFSGMHGANTSTSLVYTSGDTDPNHPTVTSPTFIEVDMTSNAGAVFTALEYPSSVTARAEGGLVWLPYGTKGVLMVIGGVEIPGDLYLITPPRDLVSNNTLMTNISIYDIESQAWYTQETLEQTDRPTQLASFCTAAVPTKDGHGWEIFLYGGYNGDAGNPLDDVWVLSVPAFQWTRVFDGSKSINHARQGSICVAPNPTTMITVGGGGQFGTYLTSNSTVDIFDLNSMQWTGKYNASSEDTLVLQENIWTQAKYPDANGPGSGPVTNLNGNLNTLFSTPYSGRAVKFGPYANATTTSTPTATATPGPTPPANNHTVAIACGVAIPIVVIAALIIGFCCLKKRRKNKAGVQRTQESRGNVFSWLGKSSAIDPAPEKSHTSDETAVNSANEYTHDKHPISEIYEAPGSNPTTPGWGNHGNAQVLSGSMATSPFMGSAEVDAQSRHEIMDHAPRDGQPFRQHPMYPRSFSGDQVTSMRSDSISHASTSVMPSRHYGHVSPYEMAQDRSREDLATPPADVNLGAPRAEANPNASSHSLGLGAEHVHSPVALIPVAPVSRKPVNSSAVVEDNRPRHQRNQSSMSSDLPNLPSPGPEEDRRRSRLLETLPDPKSAQSSPIQPQTAKRSVYKEDLDS